MFGDNVFETSATTGTGTLTLAGAVTGARTFRTAFGDGPVTAAYILRSAIEDGQFEVGVGSFEHSGGNDTLTRDTVLASSNSDAAVNWGAGTRNVFVGPPAAVLTGLASGNIGANRPAWLPQGGSWVDIVSSTVWNLYLYDGSDDILQGTFNPTANTWTAKGTRWAFGTAIDDDDVDGSNILTLPADGFAFAFTGTQQVDAIASVGIGTEIELHFGSARQLTHSADLDLPGGADITTADGDVAKFREYASGDWRCTSYLKADGTAVVADPTPTVSGLVQIVAPTAFPAANLIDIEDIPQTYSALVLVVAGASSNTTTRAVQVQPSTDNGSNFATSGVFGSSIITTTVISRTGGDGHIVDAQLQSSAEATSFVAVLTGYAAAVPTKVDVAGTYGASLGFSHNVMWNNTGAIDALRITWNGSGNFDAGTYALYGVL